MTRTQLEAIFEGYLRDPADSDYQRGYLACAIELYETGHPGHWVHPHMAELKAQLKP